jgi:hypothetical protein
MPAKTAFFAEWHRFPPIFPTADSSLTLGMTRENSNVKRAEVSRAWPAPTVGAGHVRENGLTPELLSKKQEHLFASLRLCARHFGCGHPHWSL